MISSSELQRSYIELYKELRKYLWDISIVEPIARLEVSIFEAFPNISDIKRNLSMLRQQIGRSDEVLVDKLHELNKLMSCSTVYMPIIITKEII